MTDGGKKLRGRGESLEKEEGVLAGLRFVALFTIIP
jgi:hypothetical protein